MESDKLRRAQDPYQETARAKSGCPLCARIVELYHGPNYLGVLENLGQVSAVCSHVRPIIRWVAQSSHSTSTRHGPHRSEIVLSTIGRGRAIWGHGGPGFPREVAMLTEGDDGGARLIDPRWVDLGVVRSWIDGCVSFHGDECGRPAWLNAIAPTRPDWLIDVVGECIVSPPMRRIQYMTLSYVWGQTRTLNMTRANISRLTAPGALGAEGLADQLPATVRHAIGLARLLGAEFLWVDSLCIMQDDPASIGRNLKMMPSIYGHAYLCITAEGGQDANFGLRGVRGISAAREMPQFILTLDGGERLASLPGPEDSSQSLSYHQQAWTFQEWMFSKRRLAFGHGPVGWQCQCKEWREDLVHDVRDQGVAIQDLRALMVRQSLSTVPTLEYLASLISEFNRRSLTFPQDAPRAFAGIQGLLHQTYPGGLVFGLPEYFFDVALCWAPAPNSPRRGLRYSKDAPARSSSPATLPRWSWMAWYGEIDFPLNNMTARENLKPGRASYMEPLTQWYTMASPDAEEKRPIRNGWHERLCRYDPRLLRGTPPELPPGWTRHEPGAGFMYHHYSHESSSPHEAYYYPIETLRPDGHYEQGRQTRYLSCQTRRARVSLGGEQGRPLFHAEDDVLNICDASGTLLISMALASSADEAEIKRAVQGLDPPATTLDLVAICRARALMPRFELTRDGAALRRSRTSAFWDAECVFVLWVEWTAGGVALRRASGQVTQEFWERVREEELVDLVLG